MTIKSGKQYSSAAVLRRESAISMNWSSGWLTCNMGWSRQSLMKLAPCSEWRKRLQLVFVPEMGVFSISFNFVTTFQVGVSGWRLCTGLLCGQQTALEIGGHPEAGRSANTNCYWRFRGLLRCHLKLAIPIHLRVSSLSAATFARHLKACLFRLPS